ncbi:MAG: hypothetical protein KIC80_07615 [Brachyspira sp.]|nr:hypothetical protein [Brachyspira sp.]
MKNNSVSFTSKIQFVDRQCFSMLKKKNYIGYRHNELNILKAPEFYSTEIRTCTGGGLVTPNVEAEGFHFWDDLTNKKKFNILVNSMFRFVKNPERGILLGSKELNNVQSKYSVEQFQNFKKVFMEKVKNITLFEQHRNANSQTHYHYNLDTDTWTLCSSFMVPGSGKVKYITKLNDLRECFVNISIADGDRLFIGKKKIKFSDAPDIFKTQK